MIKSKLSFFVIFYIITLLIAGLLTLSGCSQNDVFIDGPEPPTPDLPEEPTAPEEPDITELPDYARFKLSLYTHHPSYTNDDDDLAAFPYPAPFDFIGFRMLRGDGQFSPFNDQLTVQQISDNLNFPTQSFFGKYFKKNVGVSPKFYRNS